MISGEGNDGMKKPIIVAMLFLFATVLSGCQTLKDWFNDRFGPPSAMIDCKKTFEEGRRAECDGDVLNAIKKYEYLANYGSCYGQYGLANLLLKHYIDYDEYAAELLIDSIVNRANNALYFNSDPAMDSAFSVAAMAELAEIAASEDIKVQDNKVEISIADLLHNKMSKVAIGDVVEWANEKKMNTANAKIYKDIIAAVEFGLREYKFVKDIGWEKIKKAFVKGHVIDVMYAGGGTRLLPKEFPYSVVRFVKVPGAVCQYDFEVQLSGSSTFDAIEKVKSAMRRQLVKDFQSAHPTFSIDDVGISFSSWDHSGSTIKGTVVAKVLKMSVERLEYNDETGSGKIAIRLGDSDVMAAKKMAIDNIEVLVSRKNIVNVVGKRPPKGARYMDGTERMPEADLLEVEFTCK